jgi:septal ring factor EnvC (AmiA/AmiB activator)
MKKLTLLLISFFTAFAVWAQPAQEKIKMENERKAIQQEIQRLQSDYNKVRGYSKQTLGQLHLLQRKLAVQDRLLANINKEIRIISDDIYLSSLELNRLQKELDTLKQQYAKSVVYAYKNRTNYDFLNFIFSANTFNDAMRRVTYLKSYRNYQEKQVANILETQKIINDRKNQLLAKKNQKNSALQNQQQQYKVLDEQKREKDAVAAKLKSQEKDLSKQLTTKRKRDIQLKNQISAIVKREIAEARKAAEAEAKRKREAEEAANRANPTAATPTPVKTTTAAAPKSYLTLNKEEARLAAGFESNKNRLPWPVDNGVVSIPFGTSKLDGLSFDNPGITISTPTSGTTVKAVFDGEVSAVSNLGDGMMVMIRHGNYFTVYSNLSSANVSKGSVVKTGQAIGRTAVADDGSGGQLDFMIMIEAKGTTKNVSPESWLR